MNKPIPFSGAKTSWSLRSFGNQDKAVNILVQVVCGQEFQLIWVNARESIGLNGWSEAAFCKKLPNCLPKQLYCFCKENFHASTFSSAFGGPCYGSRPLELVNWS